MRYLIDGYNVMYAGGLLGKRLGPDRFRKVRGRFLNDLAAALGPIESHQTTVVFDASDAPAEFPHETSHNGISVIYAVDDADADERIERLILSHPNPKSLTVVSSDRRLRRAAERRKAVAVTAESFWETLDTLRERQRSSKANPSAARPEAPRDRVVSSEESVYWLRVFADLDALPETRQALGANDNPMLTDAEIAEIEREIERESD